jgi:endonuclease/exonuclease/phosphatase family metal-dependent hydrolase
MRYTRLPRPRRLQSLAVFLSVIAFAGCTGGYAIARHDTAGLHGLNWFAPVSAGDRAVLARWAAGVGPAVVRTSANQQSTPTDTLCVISWNTAMGAGNLERLVADVRGARPNAPVVLLLQEVYRNGPEVPVSGERLSFAGRLGGEGSEEIEALADRLGMNLYYVPSMRNGAPWDSDEDRGNAILSTLRLEDLGAVELPFERQRRVAVAATVSGLSPSGLPWRMRLVSAHFDNTVGPKRGWILGGEFARVRQTRALLDFVGRETPTVLGGDLNTWFGFHEPSYAAIARAFPDTDSTDRRPTFMGLLRLDHLFFRLPDGWRGTFRRAESRYGSDHYPLLGWIRIESVPPESAH